MEQHFGELLEWQGRELWILFPNKVLIKPMTFDLHRSVKYYKSASKLLTLAPPESISAPAMKAPRREGSEGTG